MSSWSAGLHDSHLSDRTDSYLDLRTGLLRNLLGATTREGFVERETSATFRRAVKLEADPVEVTGDLRQLQEIHRRIFQDVFVWAGQTRTDEIRKSDDYFMSPSVFATDGVKVFTDLAAEDLLVGIGTADFIERLAHHFNQLNYFHPFREGNGRAQRFFWSQIAEHAGHPLDWRRIDRATNAHAARTAMERGDLRPLKKMIAATLLSEAAISSSSSSSSRELRPGGALSVLVGSGSQPAERSVPSPAPTGRCGKPRTNGTGFCMRRVGEHGCPYHG